MPVAERSRTEFVPFMAQLRSIRGDESFSTKGTKYAQRTQSTCMRDRPNAFIEGNNCHFAVKRCRPN